MKVRHNARLKVGVLGICCGKVASSVLTIRRLLFVLHVLKSMFCPTVSAKNVQQMSVVLKVLPLLLLPTVSNSQATEHNV